MNQQADGSTWPTAVLTSAFCPDFDPQRLAMAMCVGYFERTRAAANPESFAVSGYVSSKARWREFETCWSRALRRETLAAFKADDFSRAIGEFATGWDDERQRALIETLRRLTEQHVFHAFSCAVRLEDYDSVDAEYTFRETAAGPYGLCAALVMVNVRQWIAARHPDHLTLFVFEAGDIDPRELRRILEVEQAGQGEPAQMWPREWVDERGRHRYLRPLEACGLFEADRNGAIVNRLLERSLLDREAVDRDRLLRICDGLKIPHRCDTAAAAKRKTLEIRSRSPSE